MKTYPVIVAGNAPAGTRLWLTDAQASARDHALTSLKRTSGGRKLYELTAPLGFKAGEELAVEGELDGGFKRLFGLDQDKTPTPMPAREHKPGRKALAAAKQRLQEVTTAAAEAEKALQDATSDENKAEAGKKLDTARHAVAEAEAAVKAAS